MKKQWKKFDELCEKCYLNMMGANKEDGVWDEAFDILLDIISTGRESNPNYAKELVELDDSTDFSHDIGGWLEDYLDELDMRRQFDRLLEVGGKLLDLFFWEDEKPSDIRFRMASALGEQGNSWEALDFCEKWYQEEKDNTVAATALIYARLGVKDLQGAEELVRKYISGNTACTDENDIVFIAASALYKVNGNKKEEKRIDKAIKTYEEELEAYYMGTEDELPFH